MSILLYVASFLFIVLAAYRFGRMSGKREGYNRAQAEIPIRLRAQFQLEERCPICDDKQEYSILKSQNQR